MTEIELQIGATADIWGRFPRRIRDPRIIADRDRYPLRHTHAAQLLAEIVIQRLLPVRLEHRRELPEGVRPDQQAKRVEAGGVDAVHGARNLSDSR